MQDDAIMKLATEGLDIVHDPMEVANQDDGDEDAKKKKKKPNAKAKGKPKKPTLALSPSTKQAVLGTAVRQVASPSKAKLDVYALDVQTKPLAGKHRKLRRFKAHG